jgi:hypothetical protein
VNEVARVRFARAFRIFTLCDRTRPLFVLKIRYYRRATPSARGLSPPPVFSLYKFAAHHQSKLDTFTA